jgi:hypothetical protein
MGEAHAQEIDYIIVYTFSRAFRNSIDAAITKRDLKKYGVRVVSTKLDLGESPESNLVESIIHAVDQYHDTGRAALNTVLDLLAHPDQLYRLASKPARHILNQALFTRLYIDADDTGPTVTHNEPTEPLAPLLGGYTAQQHDSGDPVQPDDTAADHKPSRLLHTALEGQCSSNTPWVEPRPCLEVGVS